MRLCTFSAPGGGPVPGRIEGDRVIALGARDLVAVLDMAGDAPEVGEFRLADVRLCAPVPEPPSLRDFFAFEQHVATARANRGAEVPAEWYEIPVFYFSNPAAIFGPEDAIPHPRASQELDYELEVAAVIGRDGQIAGFTVMNDWSARDLQRQEVRVGLGPAKGKDFATSLGPVLVTVDEFDGGAAEMVARVNGEERSRGNLRDLYHSWEAIVGRASLNTRLRTGDVLGSGTVGTGCILEADDGRWLRVDDVVELEVEGIGVLRNAIAPPR
jgi:fumarylacetoacetate (FAA) hydrolase